MKSSTITMLLALFLLSSCVSSYQFFDTVAVDADTINENKIEFEEDSILFTYNLWSAKGDPGITIINNSTQNLVIDLKNSFFVKNDLAIPYYDGKQISFSGASSVSTATPVLDYTGYSSVSGSKSAGYAVSVKQDQYLIVPPKTYRVLSGFKIINGYYRISEVDPHPPSGKKSFKTFEPDNTPLRFGNILTYTLGDSSLTARHNFYVAEIFTLAARDVERVGQQSADDDLSKRYQLNAVKNAKVFYYKYAKN